MSIEHAIEDSFYQLDDFLKTSTWHGRENEVVNLYCHHFLVKQSGIVPEQCGIEVSVKQLPGIKRKNLVRKDLVVWHNSNDNVWTPSTGEYHHPAAIIEWKVNFESKCAYDINWLKEYTTLYPSVIGYSACAHVVKNRSIVFNKIINGKVVGSI